MGRTRPTDSSIPQARPFVTWYFVRWRTFWVGRGARKRPGALPAGLEACGGGFWPSCVAKKDAAASEVPAIRTVPETNSKPSAAGSSWKGGARERREKSGAPVRERPILSGADFAPTCVATSPMIQTHHTAPKVYTVSTRKVFCIAAILLLQMSKGKLLLFYQI